MIRFSVILPLYNKANYVQKSIESILKQTYNEFEIVVVNDGSTDNSIEVVSSFVDSRIHIFTKENGGVSSARNYGIEKAQYEYIAFLDADDLWLPDYLETIKEMIEQYPQAGAFATTYTTIDSFGNKCIRTSSKLEPGATLLVTDYCKSIIKGEIYQIGTDSICVKKALFNSAGGFRAGIKRGEDIDMWLRLSLITPFVWKNESKTLYNLDTENNAMAGYTSNTHFPINEFVPFWEWYSYSSSFYLKMYTNRKLLWLFRQSNYKDKMRVFFKINWFHFLSHFLYSLTHK